jgi:ABC-type transport system involved in cytochrome bd biosynthesis fused ATPase/permease subunit
MTRATSIGRRGQQAGEITTLATKGLDGLDAYFARYLPRLVLAVVVPLAVLARVVFADWISADLARIPADRWLPQLAWVPQHPHLFATTVAANIALGQPAARRPEIEAAARLAGADDFIRRLPHSYDTVLTEGARGLSAGQRQKIALARALLADPALLILDEPAAHLPPDARRALTADLLAATAGRATLLITHDRDGLDQLDEIVVLADGRVVERGSHAALMRAHGPYQRMWQTG